MKAQSYLTIPCVNFAIVSTALPLVTCPTIHVESFSSFLPHQPIFTVLQSGNPHAVSTSYVPAGPTMPVSSKSTQWMYIFHSFRVCSSSYVHLTSRGCAYATACSFILCMTFLLSGRDWSQNWTENCCEPNHFRGNSDHTATEIFYGM